MSECNINTKKRIVKKKLLDKIFHKGNQTISSLKKSVFINYKSWFLLIVSVLILSSNNIIKGLKTFFFMLFASHLFHYSCHLALYTNSVHLYHHNHNNYLSHISQIILEFCSILFFIFSKHIWSWNFLNEYIIIFYYLFYTTVHNVNYSIFHVNNVHENHHKLLLLNLGPDFCDILFQTKFDVMQSLENTDHYLGNILFALLFVLVGKLIWHHASSDEKIIISNIFVFIYGIMASILTVLTILFNFI